MAKFNAKIIAERLLTMDFNLTPDIINRELTLLSEENLQEIGAALITTISTKAANTGITAWLNDAELTLIAEADFIESKEEADRPRAKALLLIRAIFFKQELFEKGALRELNKTDLLPIQKQLYIETIQGVKGIQSIAVGLFRNAKTKIGTTISNTKKTISDAVASSALKLPTKEDVDSVTQAIKSSISADNPRAVVRGAVITVGVATMGLLYYIKRYIKILDAQILDTQILEIQKAFPQVLESPKLPTGYYIPPSQILMICGAIFTVGAISSAYQYITEKKNAIAIEAMELEESDEKNEEAKIEVVDVAAKSEIKNIIDQTKTEVYADLEPLFADIDYDITSRNLASEVIENISNTAKNTFYDMTAGKDVGGAKLVKTIAKEINKLDDMKHSEIKAPLKERAIKFFLDLLERFKNTWLGKKIFKSAEEPVDNKIRHRSTLFKENPQSMRTTVDFDYGKELKTAVNVVVNQSKLERINVEKSEINQVKPEHLRPEQKLGDIEEVTPEEENEKPGLK